MSFLKEIERRRTFGIISHPDAGKTTLTEKLLLFGGAIQEAGAVKNNKIIVANLLGEGKLRHDSLSIEALVDPKIAAPYDQYKEKDAPTAAKKDNQPKVAKKTEHGFKL